MDPQATERLKTFLAQLPPRSQAMLMREFERAVASGKDAAIASFVLQQLRSVVRAETSEAGPRQDEAIRQALVVIEPFLVDGNGGGAGQIRRSSMGPIKQWIAGVGLPEQMATLLSAPVDSRGEFAEEVLADFHAAAATAIAGLASPANIRTNNRALPQIGPANIIDDLVHVGTVFGVSRHLAELEQHLLRVMRVFGDAEITRTVEALDKAVSQHPQAAPFALQLIKQRLGSPWQLIRLAVKGAGSDEESRVAGSIYGCAVSIVIHDLADLASTLRADLKRARFDQLSKNIKAVYEGVRGLRTELDIRSDSSWGKQLAAIRKEVSSALQSEIESVPGRVRRLLRQRPDKEVTATSRVDPIEVDETVALIDFVATCRTYAGELAINEVTMRTFSELQQYVERSTESLVAALRTPDPKVRAFRKQQVDAAVRFCEVLFGFDYASLMSRAAENAVIAERKPVPRAG